MSGLSAQQWSMLMDRYAAPLELFASQWTQSPADIVQEAFIELIRTESFPDDPGAWLFKVVRNKSLNAARSGRRRRERESSVAKREALFEPSSLDAINTEEATAALQELPDEQREVIVAKLWGNQTLETIAEMVGVSVATVHRRYMAGIESLRTRFQVKWTNQD
ncbi:MAG: sigma-70 family RNA polymerase sigma factor [Pirellulaceae bacterium]